MNSLSLICAVSRNPENVVSYAQGVISQFKPLMYHIGTDIIEIARIEQAVNNRGERFLRRVFTDPELSYCQMKPASLAACFAGKEAVYKALGATRQGIGWRDIEILSESRTKPVVRLHGAALNYAHKLGLDHLAISLAHSREYAIAFVIGETR